MPDFIERAVHDFSFCAHMMRLLPELQGAFPTRLAGNERSKRPFLLCDEIIRVRSATFVRECRVPGRDALFPGFRQANDARRG